MAKRLLITTLAIIGLMAGSLATVYFQSPATDAASMSDFDAGNIIDDAVFYDGNSMSASQIQTFLNNKVKNCDTQGSQPYLNTGQTVKQYWTARGEPAPYTCLKDYKQKTPEMMGQSGICSYMKGYGSRTAAQIISDVAKACGISPKVLLVLLQKEQSLVTDNSPLRGLQYGSATGMGCPDTAGCDPKYDGYFNQVYGAARQYKLYRANPTNYNYVAGRDNYIQYNPDASCGGSIVKIKNQATAGLYNYTPYQPNAATKKVAMGVTAPCGAYGNKNFYLLFTSWFGGTHFKSIYEDMKIPRWMEVKEDNTYKIIPETGEVADNNRLAAGRQIFFTSKITIDGKTYLRTKANSDKDDNKAIPLDQLRNIDLKYTDSKEPGWFIAKINTKKVLPLTGEKNGASIPKGMVRYYSSEATVGGYQYLRTQYGTNSNQESAVPRTDLAPISVSVVDIKIPRWLTAVKDIHAYDILNTSTTSYKMSAGDMSYFEYKIEIEDKTYLIDKSLYASGSFIGYDWDDLINSNTNYVSLKNPRPMKLLRDSAKLDGKTLKHVGAVHPAGKQIVFTTKKYINGQMYLRTQINSDGGLDRVFPYALLSNV